MSIPILWTTDVVFVDTLRVAANLGKDWWGRDRSQPCEISVYLHLKNSYLQAAGESDNVADSVHYGHLTKTISTMIKDKSATDDPGFDGADALVKAVAGRAFALTGDVAKEVRVVLDLPKIILLASGFSVDAVLELKGGEVVMVSKRVCVKEIVIPVIIGVNAPEREAKQRVLINTTFYETPGTLPAVPYQKVISELCQKIEGTSYLTLEKFVTEIVRDCCLSSEAIAAVTARAQKPSALSFAQSSGVEITRRREAFTSS
ncbi:hypothetical protein D9619_009270 [Psilocybe cf. subviscida]|uniref:dihydroneopterin aldolase n=1 Tax=Psilocybe cf. subviscida TaxID=2480587 RepID=A0A8H5BU00_9AGAR|nr:hypothetical protein D9619_009270 [Psilocybe cf. subviscida]